MQFNDLHMLPQLDEFTNFCGSDEGRLIVDQLAMVQVLNAG